ncbi:hypothetical protein KKE92_06465 [Candidatus Micrarchaeota archaeon]|nr:hypothetical protein [Candidatus Micrarchaeota archaeon]MBU1682278.1 hypothetical protein [Candidatus Micrarchaeota archaeon]
MKKLLIFLLLVPMAFAAWQSVAGVAIMISLGIVAAIYMVGKGFGINELQMMGKEEMFQLIATGILVVVLVSSDGLLNAISTSDAFSEGQPTMQTNAMAMLDNTIGEMGGILSTIQNNDRKNQVEGSKSSQCSIMGTGYSVSGCGGYSMLASPMSMAGGIVGFSIGELSAVHRLIQISNEYAFSLLLPLGIVLRTIKLTRGAGGLLIALGISLHIMLPAGIIFSEMLASSFAASPESAAYTGAAEDIDWDDYECNAGDTMPVTADKTENEENVIDVFNIMKSNIRKYMFQAMIRGTLGPVLALLLMAGSIKAISSAAGSEVDVSALSRFV